VAASNKNLPPGNGAGSRGDANGNRDNRQHGKPPIIDEALLAALEKHAGGDRIFPGDLPFSAARLHAASLPPKEGAEFLARSESILLSERYNRKRYWERQRQKKTREREQKWSEKLTETQRCASERAEAENSSFHAATETDLANVPMKPNRAAIQTHIEFIIGNAADEYPEALVEIAYEPHRAQRPSKARLFHLHEIKDAVAFAADINGRGLNVYVGVGLRKPDSPRNFRCSTEQFYVATCLAIDIDQNHDSIFARLESAAPFSLRIITGTVPQTRAHYWVRLDAPCASHAALASGLEALCNNVGSDPNALGAARIMRLGGTVNFPSDSKKTKSYIDEITAVTLAPNPAATSIDALIALSPRDRVKVFGDDPLPISDDDYLKYDLDGRVVDGREAFFRDTVISCISDYQRKNNADPSEEQVFDLACSTFFDPERVDHRDAKWTGEHGKAGLRKRVINTMRRFRSGDLDKHGLGPVDGTADRRKDNGANAGEDEEIERASEANAEPDENRETGRYPPSNDENTSSTERFFDPWERFDVPAFPFDILPTTLRQFVEGMSQVIGCDPSGLAMTALGAVSGSISHAIHLKLMRHGNFLASPRLWVLLVGPPSAKKTPMMKAAMGPIMEYETRSRDIYDEEVAEHRSSEGAPADAPKPPPRYIVSDTTVEKLGEIIARSDRGTLVWRDEIAGWIGSMEKYSGGKASMADRAFWLQAFDGGPYMIDRVQRGEIRVGNLSVSLLGGIQPKRLQELHGLTSDGLAQRFLPCIVTPSAFRQDIPVKDVADAYKATLQACIKIVPMRDDDGNLVPLLLDDDAIDVMRGLHSELHDLELASSGLAGGFDAFVGKLAGLSGSLTLILHLAEDPSVAVSKPVPRRIVENVRMLVMEFLVPHALEFYRTAERMTSGEVHQKVAGYILTSGKDRFTPSDFTANVACLRGLSPFDLNQKLGGLVTGGWLIPIVKGPLPSAWNLNPKVHERMKGSCPRWWCNWRRASRPRSALDIAP
jgi:hypothetical protein